MRPFVPVLLRAADVYKVFDDRQHYLRDVTAADLYKCVEFRCELPGAGLLQVH